MTFCKDGLDQGGDGQVSETLLPVADLACARSGPVPDVEDHGGVRMQSMAVSVLGVAAKVVDVGMVRVRLDDQNTPVAVDIGEEAGAKQEGMTVHRGPFLDHWGWKCS